MPLNFRSLPLYLHVLTLLALAVLSPGCSGTPSDDDDSTPTPTGVTPTLPPGITPTLAPGVTPTPVTPEGPVLTVAREELYFGTVLMGDTGTLSLELANDGNESLDVTLQVTKDYNSVFSVQGNTAVSVPAGKTHTSTLLFSPNGPVVFSAELKLESNDPAASQVLLLLVGQGQEPVDEDDDGFYLGDDCDDLNPEIYPGSPELCDGLDNDCSGSPDHICETTDNDQDGSVLFYDCNDSDPLTYPGAPELCDGSDRDCNGEATSSTVFMWFKDLDGDGYGLETDGLESCFAPTGYAPARGDCNEADTAIHPFATEASDTDGVDQNCDNLDGTGSKVIGPESSIQSALDASIHGQTVWVGPGTYVAFNLNFKGKQIRLAAVGMQARTTIDGTSKGSIFVFASAEDERSWLDGFTLTRGSATNGGAISLSSSSPRISDLDLVSNTASSRGGALYLLNANPTLTRIFGGKNRAGSGGGMYAEKSNPTLTDIELRENSASSGGAIYLKSANPTGSHITADNNEASTRGGALSLDSSSPVLSDLMLSGNFAGEDPNYTADGEGGGIHLNNSSPLLQRITLSANRAGGGGGIYSISSSATLIDVVISNNHADYYGGGAYFGEFSESSISQGEISENSSDGTAGGLIGYLGTLSLSNVTLRNNTTDSGITLQFEDLELHMTNTTVVENRGTLAGGVCLVNVAATITNSLFAYNYPYNLYNDPTNDAGLTIQYSNLYKRPGAQNHNLPSLDSTNVTVEPGFAFYSPNNDSTDDDFHLRPSSPLRNIGSPSITDPDGTRSDIGAYGGPLADISFYQDADNDSLFDGWEQRYLGSLASSGTGDDDADGLSNLKELQASTLPTVADTDIDNHGDGKEVSAGTNPLASSSQPGHNGLVVLRVPEDFTNLQTAINWCGDTCEIALGAGTLIDSARIEGRLLTLHGAGATATILQATPGERALTVLSSELDVAGLTIKGGTAEQGGGMHLNSVGGIVQNMIVTENIAEEGAGIWLQTSNLTLSHLTITDNNAVGSGGGIYLYDSDPTIVDSAITYNTSGSGGGINMAYSDPTLERVVIAHNAGDSNGDGGGIRLFSSDATLSQVELTYNTSSDGGALAAVRSNLVIRHSVLANNAAAQGGGVSLSEGTVSVQNSVIAFNTASSGGNVYATPGTDIASELTLTYSTLFNPTGVSGYSSSYSANANIFPTGTYLTVEPKFAAYTKISSTYTPCTYGVDSSCVPYDLHLASNSPLINAADPTLTDADGSRADIGLYGTLKGSIWDRDYDSFPDWFWPGSITTPPSGFSRSSYDSADLDASVH